VHVVSVSTPGVVAVAAQLVVASTALVDVLAGTAREVVA
jgi:hypothetical protein